MTTFNHAYAIGFEVRNSSEENGNDVTPQQLRAAILGRIERLGDDEILEAVGLPFDTYEEEQQELLVMEFSK